ncbi:MAG: hypothetical protein IJU66_03180, partial [Oscillospiraceae bacterium]|nr:hypothetical protein [Oscillospiraceae bacterium]
RLTGSQEVSGSIPLISTRNKKDAVRRLFCFWWRAARAKIKKTRLPSGSHRLRSVAGAAL